ncbi:MAG: peptide ABC transporter substrate-binding protein [Verrucomicrobiales bacterium]
MIRGHDENFSMQSARSGPACAPMRILIVLFWTGLLATMGGLTSCHRSETRAQRAAREGILLVGNGAEPRSLDPHIASGVTEHHLLISILEGLVSEAPEGDGVAPGAAARWESNEALDEWTFHLRPEGRWSNGDPVTAHDFVWAYRRILTPSLGGEYAAMLYLLKGAEEFNQGKSTDPETIGAKALDDLTLRLSLVGPTPYFPNVLPHYAWFPVHAPSVLKHGRLDTRASRWTHPGHFVGNGPFQLKTWRFKHLIEVERNPYYWDAANVKLNGIRFLPIDNIPAEERMFRDGQLHVTETVPLDKIEYWRDKRPESYYVHPYLAVYFYRVNVTRPPLNDRRVRHALSLAIDRAAITKNILKAGQIPAVGLVPPVAGYTGPSVLKFDPVEARRLLAEAGFSESSTVPRFDILFNVSESHRTTAEAVQQMWKSNLGISVGLNSQDWGVYLDALQRLDYDAARAGWTADYTDPITFLDMWTTGNGNNMTGWSRPEFDALIAKSRTIRDDNERFAVLREAESLFLEDLPAIPLYVYVRNYLVSPSVTGWDRKLLDSRPWKHIGLRLNPPPDAP